MSAQTLEHLDGYISEPLYSVEELIARSMESVREFEAGEFVSAEESNRMMDEHIAQAYAPAV